MSYQHKTSFDKRTDYWNLGSLLMDPVDGNPQGMHVELSMADVCQSHINIIGGSGAGKSSLSELMIRQLWSRPRESFLPGGLLVDPHGDLAESLLLHAREHAGRLHPDLDIVYLEPSGPYSFLLDPFDPSYCQSIPEYDRSDWVEGRAGICALAMARAEGALDFREMQRLGQWLSFFFTVAGTPVDEQGSHLPLGQINVLYQRTHKNYQKTWDTIYPHLSDKMQAEADHFFALKGKALQDEITSTVRRLRHITSGPVAPIFSAEGTTLNLKECITGGKWVLLNLQQQGAFKEHHTDLLGRLTLSLFVESILELQEHERRHFFLWVDEALRFAGPDMIRILKQCRKYQATGVYCLQDLAGLDVANTDLARQMLNQAKTTLCFGLQADEDLKAMRSTLALPNINFDHKQTLRNISFNEHQLVELAESIDGVDYAFQEADETAQGRQTQESFTHETRRTTRRAQEHRTFVESSDIEEQSSIDEQSLTHTETSEHEQANLLSQRTGIDRSTTRGIESRTAWERFNERSREHANEQAQIERSEYSDEFTGALRIGSRDSQASRQVHGVDREKNVRAVKADRQSIGRTNQYNEDSNVKRISEGSYYDPEMKTLRTEESNRRTTDQDTTSKESALEQSLGLTRRETEEDTSTHVDELLQEIANRRTELTGQSSSSVSRQGTGKRDGTRRTNSDIQTRQQQQREFDESAEEIREIDRVRSASTQGVKHADTHKVAHVVRQGEQQATILSNEIAHADSRSQSEILSQHQKHIATQSKTVHTGTRRKQQMIGLQRLVVDDGGLLRSIEEQNVRSDQILRMLDTAQIMLAHRNAPTVVLQVHRVEPPYADEHPTILRKIRELCKGIGSQLSFVFRRSDFQQDKHPLDRWFQRIGRQPKQAPRHSPAPPTPDNPPSDDLPDGF